jgi:hypothetical protein
MPGWQSFTKAEAVELMPVAAKARLSSVNQYDLKRLAKSEAKTPRGMMRAGDKIIKEGQSPAVELKINKTEGLGSAEEPRLIIDHNAYRTRVPFHRVESPHGARKRRLPGWTDCRFILPKVTLEGLRALTIQLAHEQQNSDWPSERRRYARTKNFYIVWALNLLFERLGFQEFCVEEQKPTDRRVRRFVAPNT